MSNNVPETNPYYLLFEKQRNNRQTIINRPVMERIGLLSRLEKSLQQYREDFHKAVYRDFRKPATETDITELYPVLNEIRHAKSNLRNWTRPEKVDNPLAFSFTQSTVVRNGKGNCLIISPWNYPVLLTLGPLVSAIAAGNTVIIKPSEFTPATSGLMKQILTALFDDAEIAMVEGGKEISGLLLQLPFDHICFTGSPAVGKLVMQAAAKNLTSVTLELGGKSPVYIHHDTNIKDAAAKITAAKLTNAGQSCVAPDYVLVHHELKGALLTALESAFTVFYNRNRGENNPNYASVINDSSYNRLEKFSPGYTQPPKCRENLIFEPVIMSDASLTDPVMNEEIFGPILPVISVLNAEEAIKIIHKYPEPLCVYVFAREDAVKSLFKKNTRSGSICFNDCAVQFLHAGLPFGGIGKSGIGRLHGKAGFLSFTDEKVIFRQRVGFTVAKLLYPPYNPFKKMLINLLLKYF